MSQRVKGTAIGIDLGTTYSCAAIWFRGKKRVEIIPNEQGNRITPSCVAFNDSELLLGESAKNQIARNPTNTVFDAKRLIGSRFSDPQVQQDMKLWPFEVIKGDVEKPSVVVKFMGKKKIYSPEEISAMILKNMKESAEVFIGREVTDAVITVPAYFNNQQREATKEAGTIAGLNVLRLLNEPTAAAIAYGVDIMAEKQLNKDMSVLVFDLGGGTFDVSLLTISRTGAIEVKAVGGDTHLGGEDFDMTLVDYCITEFKKKHRNDIRGNPRSIARLKVACEKAKKDLSSTSLVPIEIDCLYEGVDFSIKISRAKFEELNSNYFDRCIQLIEKCLCDGKMKKMDLDEVVLVGGSSRIPKIQRMVEFFFEGKRLCKSLNGDEAVASGAAILAARLIGSDDGMIKDVVLLDVTPLSLGIETKGLNGEGGNMDVIIPRNTSIPTSKKKLYILDVNQTEAGIYVYQGEDTRVEGNTLLGEFQVSGIAPGPDGRSRIEVSFNLDSNGILIVSANDKSNKDNLTSITIAKT
ncbi:heat shock cognate 70 kDa protein [Tanacetum coccineum]